MDTVRPQRDYRIDFWRGVALLMIFVNHVPGNVFEHLTSRNYGFSDAAELFVFLAGFAAALAYLRKFVAGDEFVTSAKAVTRGMKLYIAHITTVALAVALFAAAALASAEPDFLNQHGIGRVFSDPVHAFIGLVTLGHQIGYFNILPMYIFFLVGLPGIMWLAQRDLRLALFASGGVWLVAQTTGLNLPNWPADGGWFFNPFAWQFLFTIGLAVGALTLRPGGGVGYSRTLFRAALAFVIVAFVWRVSGFGLSVVGLEKTAVQSGFNKNDLGIFRILHILAIVYVVVHGPWGAWLRDALSAANPVVLIGRHSLIIFCLGSLMAAFGQVVMYLYEGSLTIGLVVVPAGLLMHFALARILEWYRLQTTRKVAPSRGEVAAPAASASARVA